MLIFTFEYCLDSSSSTSSKENPQSIFDLCTGGLNKARSFHIEDDEESKGFSSAFGCCFLSYSVRGRVSKD
jgi:hypothetical protein